jgi:hypothetical protein
MYAPGGGGGSTSAAEEMHHWGVRGGGEHPDRPRGILGDPSPGLYGARGVNRSGESERE